MSERKIRFAPNHVGGWWAFIGDLGVAAETPWEASAALVAALGGGVPVEWETLPWTTAREALGIVHSVAHILGASLEARRAIDAAVYAEEMRQLGASEYWSLPAEERARLAAAAAERLVNLRYFPEEWQVERALRWARAAGVALEGYGEAVEMLAAAVERERGSDPWLLHVRQAAEALIVANARNDIAPDSR